MNRTKMTDKLVHDDINTIMESAIHEDYEYLIDNLTGEVKGYNHMSDKELASEFAERFIEV